jgi:protein-S-isoprenylcysteine O-methyltransferase Ste14
MEKKLPVAFLFVLLFPALIILLSGDVFWAEGWIFSAWFIVLCFATITYLYRKDPALLEERYKQPGSGNEAGWDKYVVVAIFFGFVIWIVIMPFDAKRYAWSPPFPLWLEGVGIVMLVGSFYFFFRSFAENTYLSPLVRVQEDRKQQVISTGVYGFVRHPMYLGAVLMLFGAPLLLSSIFGIVVGLGLTVLLMARIVGEERLLKKELEGYWEYTKKVRYRLIPGIW